jgi:hypothetical protein
MLGGMSCAFAQEGPSEKMRGNGDSGSSVQDRGGGDAGTQERGPSSQGDRSKSSDPGDDGSKARAAEKSESSSKSEPSKGRSAEKQSDTKRATKSDDTSSGTRESRSDNSNKAGKAAKQDDTSGKSAQEKGDQTDADTGTKDTKATEGEKASTDKAKQVDLSGDKRTRLQAALRDKSNIKHRTGVNIHLSVGSRIPRDWDLVAVPDDIVLIVPEYRGYRFAWVEDEYVICDPDTFEVVAVIPADRTFAGGSSGGGGGKCSQLSLNSEKRELVLQSVSRGHEVKVRDLSVGLSVPNDVELLTFPDSVISDVSELRSCRYFDTGDEIAIVDPDEDKIVLLIDKG